MTAQTAAITVCWMGISEAKELIGDMIEVPASNLIIYGNSSLNVMYDTISRAMTHGIMGNTPWCKLDKVKFLCPVPGYDRHFAITEYFGIEMINVPMTQRTALTWIWWRSWLQRMRQSRESGAFPSIPIHSGVSYSDQTVRRLARLKASCKGFQNFLGQCIRNPSFIRGQAGSGDGDSGRVQESRKSGSGLQVCIYFQDQFPGLRNRGSLPHHRITWKTSRSS